MNMIKKYWWVIAIAIVVVLYMRKKKATAEASADTTEQVSTARPGSGGSFTSRPVPTGSGASSSSSSSSSAGTLPSGEVAVASDDCLSGSALRQAARAECGPRCVVPVGKKCRRKRSCHKAFRAENAC